MPTPDTLLSSSEIAPPDVPGQQDAAIGRGGNDPEKTPGPEDQASIADQNGIGGPKLDAMLALAQPAGAQFQGGAGSRIEDDASLDTGTATSHQAIALGGRNGPRADHIVVPLSARQTPSTDETTTATPTESLAAATNPEAADTGAKPASTQTFGEHLAKVGADALAQAVQGQGGDAAAGATIRADLAPPALPHMAGAPGAVGAQASVAPPHPAAASHPVVSGVPIQSVPVEIGLKSLAGVNRFDIRLDPDDLGQIDVRLDISGEGKVRAHITVERPEALLSLQRETAQLERALEQAGFRTGEDGVSMSLRQQAQGESRERGGGRETAEQASSTRTEKPMAEAQPIRRYDWGRASGVDRHV